MSMTALGFSALNNIIIIAFLIILSAFRHPNCLVMISSKIEAVMMSEEEALALRAMNQIEGETAEANKRHDIIEIMTSNLIDKVIGGTK